MNELYIQVEVGFDLWFGGLTFRERRNDQVLLFVGVYLPQLCPVSVSRFLPSGSASLAPSFPNICILGPVPGFSLPNTDVL